MNEKITRGLSVTLAAGLVSGGVVAHHGGAVYDSDSTVEVVGKVTRFEFARLVISAKLVRALNCIARASADWSEKRYWRA